MLKILYRVDECASTQTHTHIYVQVMSAHCVRHIITTKQHFSRQKYYLFMDKKQVTTKHVEILAALQAQTDYFQISAWSTTEIH